MGGRIGYPDHSRPRRIPRRLEPTREPLGFALRGVPTDLRADERDVERGGIPPQFPVVVAQGVAFHGPPRGATVPRSQGGLEAERHFRGAGALTTPKGETAQGEADAEQEQGTDLHGFTER